MHTYHTQIHSNRLLYHNCYVKKVTKMCTIMIVEKHLNSDSKMININYNGFSIPGEAVREGGRERERGGKKTLRFQSNFGKNLVVCFWLDMRLAWSEELVVDDLELSSLLACLPNLVVTASMTRLDLFTWPLTR